MYRSYGGPSQRLVKGSASECPKRSCRGWPYGRSGCGVWPPGGARRWGASGAGRWVKGRSGVRMGGCAAGGGRDSGGSVTVPSFPCWGRVPAPYLEAATAQGEATVIDHLSRLTDRLDTARVREGAIRLLSEVGMAVPSANVVHRLEKAGNRITAGRLFLEPDVVSGFMQRHKAGEPAEPEEEALRLNAGSHCLYEYDAAEGRIEPLTVARLERATRLVGSLQADGTLHAVSCPGAPTDVPPQLAPLWQQFIGARFLPDAPIWAHAPDYAPHAAAMAEVLGKKLGMGVHPISPMVLGGDELDLALRQLDEGTLTAVTVAPMPVMGVTAPLDWVAAWLLTRCSAPSSCLWIWTSWPTAGGSCAAW